MVLSSKRYDKIKDEIVDLYEDHGVCALPIDCIGLAQRMKVRLMAYSQLTKKKLTAAYAMSSDGFLLPLECKLTGQMEYVIYYNDDNCHERQRFTIMHEIGHIVLDHCEESDLAEAEANFFAKYSLAPPPLVNEIEVEDYYDMAIKFDLSLQCAMYCMKYYQKWLQYGPPDYEPVEWRMIEIGRAHV